jgi:hypothetical protein
MNRRNFLRSLVGGVAAAAAVKTATILRATVHPFQNNGASSGVCKVCGDAITEHKSVLTNEGEFPLNPWYGPSLLDLEEFRRDFLVPRSKNSEGTWES